MYHYDSHSDDCYLRVHCRVYRQVSCGQSVPQLKIAANKPRPKDVHMREPAYRLRMGAWLMRHAQTFTI